MVDTSPSTLLTSHIGLEYRVRLNAFAAMFRKLNGVTRVYVTGSSVRSKEFHDVDLYVSFADETYTALYQTNNDRWWLECAAYSALGRAMTGLPLEVHIMRDDIAQKLDHPDGMVVELSS